MKKFKRKRECLDHFWLNLIKKYLEDADSLFEVVKIVLILSHGNAHVERGFSVNKECIIDNLKEETLIAYRTVYDAINMHDGVENVPIPKKLIHYARNAHDKYKESMDAYKKSQSADAAIRESRKRNQVLIKELESKKNKILIDAQKEANIIDNEILNLVKPPK